MLWQQHDIKLSTVSAISASQDHLAISYENWTGADPCVLRVDAKLSSAVVGGGSITLILQDWNGTIWRDVKSASVTTSGVYSIFINSVTDAALLPLSDRVRCVLTTGAGSSVTVNDVRLYRKDD